MQALRPLTFAGETLAAEPATVGGAGRGRMEAGSWQCLHPEKRGRY